MASIIDSIRNITEDSWWFPKLLFVAVCCFWVYYAVLTNMYDPQRLSGMAILVVMGIFGIGTFMMSAIINNTSPVLPGLINILSVFKYSIVTPILFFPGIVCGYLIYTKLVLFFPEKELSFYFIIGGIIALVFFSFSMIPLVLFAARSKISDAFNIPIVLKSAGNFIVEILSYLLQYVFTILLLLIILYYLIINVLGEHAFALGILYAFFTVLSIFSFFSFSAGIYGSGIIELEAMESKGRNDKKKSRRKTS